MKERAFRLISGFLMVVFCAITFVFGARPLFASMVKADNINWEELLGGKMNARITMDLHDAPLRDVLKMIFSQSGLNFVAAETIADRKVTLYLDNVSLRDALNKIFQISNVTYEFDEGSNIFTVKDWGRPTLDLITKVYYLKYISVTNSKFIRDNASGNSSSSSASSSDSGSSSGSSNKNGSTLTDVLAKMISTDGKITEDPATNSIIVTDLPSKFPMIDQVVLQLDIPIPQVLIAVEILDVAKSDMDQLGVKFGSGDMLSYQGPNLGGTYFPFASHNLMRSVGRALPTPAAWTMTGFTFAANFLSTRATTKFLARPKLFVLNNETAELKITTDEGINIVSSQTVGTSTTTAQNIQRAETGVALKVTPQICMDTNEITMVLEPSVKEAVTGTLVVNNQPTKDVEQRSLKSTVRVRSGETIMIGGLIRQNNPETITKVPFFSSIPIIGMAFRHKNHGPTKDREMLVFLTPRIIKDTVGMANNLQTPQTIEEREQEPENSKGSQRSAMVSRTLGVYDTKSSGDDW